MKLAQNLFMVLLLGSSIRAVAAGNSGDASTWTGDYTQLSSINFADVDDEKSCRLEAPDAKWDSGSCVEAKQNKVNISKIIDAKTPDQYLVQVDIVGGNIHTCDFAGEMTLRANKLIYQDVIPDTADICHIEVERTSAGLKLEASDNCSEYYCGFGLVLSGTDEAFKRSGPGQDVTAETAKKDEQN